MPGGGSASQGWWTLTSMWGSTHLADDAATGSKAAAVGVVTAKRRSEMKERWDLRTALAHSGIFWLFNRLIGANQAAHAWVQEYLRPLPGNRILDMGCGMSEILEYMPAVEYVGFDTSESYVAAARQRFGTRGRFFCRSVMDSLPADWGAFDRVAAKGILHHLQDAQAVRMLQTAHQALKPGGRLITFDGCYIPSQSPWARTLLSWDRGGFVRTEAAYLSLARQVFGQVNWHIRSDLLRIPYTHIILECLRT